LRKGGWIKSVVLFVPEDHHDYVPALLGNRAIEIQNLGRVAHPSPNHR
jgi:hypothetical protein